MKKIVLFFIALNLYSCSCSEDKPNYSKQTMLGWARDADPDMKIEIGSMQKTLVDCRDYQPQCVIGYRVSLKNLKFNALFYTDQKKALQAAKRIKGYYSRNWVFDEVSGEPVLERTVKEFLKAKPAF